MRRRSDSRVLLGMALAFFAASACSMGGSDSSPLGDISEALDPATEPIRVTTTINAARAASAVIGPEGGSLSATGADGSRFTLEIPAGALVQEIEITMTPIDSMDGLPTSLALAAAVHLEPEGQTFYEDVSLTVEPVEELPVDQQIPIGIDEDGALVIPFIDPASAAIRLELSHFSSAGVSKGYLADLEPVKKLLGGEVAANLESLMALEVAGWRQSSLLQSVSDEEENIDPTLDTERYKQLLDMWVDQVLKQRLAAAGENCATGRLAEQSLLAYVRYLAFLGGEAPPFAGTGSLISTMHRNCMREEYERCRDEHIVDRMIPLILALEKSTQELGVVSAEMDKVVAEAEDLARKCLTFELQFESLIQEHGPDGEATYHVRAIVTVEYIVGVGFQGSGPLEYLDFSASGTSIGAADCTGEYVGEGDTFTVWPGPLRPWAIHPVPVESISLVIDPGHPTETITLVCPNLVPVPVPLERWSEFFSLLHETEKVSAGYQIDGWEPVGVRTYARKTYLQSVSDEDETVEEQTTLDLVHTPR